MTGIKRVGREIAGNLLSRGYTLSVVYRSSEKEVEELRKEAEGSGLGFLSLKADLMEEGEWERVVEETFNRFGRLDAFIHLASPYRRTPILKTRLSDLREHARPIAEAFFFISINSYEKMLKNPGDTKGRIIAFGDWAVEETPYRDFGAYFLAKGTLHTAVKVLAKEFAPYVLVNCIALGPTLKAEELSDEEWEGILRRTPLRRKVSMKDVVALTNFLLEAESITGEVIRLDSGRHLAGSGITLTG